MNFPAIFQLLDDRGITLEDVQEAINVGERTGRKFYHRHDKNRFLASARLGNFNVYVEYSPTEGGIILHSAYAHRVMIVSDEIIDKTKDGGLKAEWNCYLCQVAVEEVEDVAIHYNGVELPSICGYRCPKCKKEMLSENTVMTMLFMAEQMLEAK